ncbi:MAG: hypothetical protein LBI65_02025, partial [Candidatus Symbiothrix sp.]|nr:hypothetical protein [Candidatus Symbiothrix sp.]
GPCGGYSFRRALPYAIDNKAFSLNLTAMGFIPVLCMGRRTPRFFRRLRYAYLRLWKFGLGYKD